MRNELTIRNERPSKPEFLGLNRLTPGRASAIIQHQLRTSARMGRTSPVIARQHREIALRLACAMAHRDLG
jgi:hypothetical protein